MEKNKIYKLAMAELLRQYEQEEKRNDGPIKKVRLPKLQAEINELHNLILEEEAKQK